MSPERVAADQTSTFPRFLDLAYPSIERGDGVWLHTTGGEKILDACSGGAMVSSLGNGASEIVEAGGLMSQAGRAHGLFLHGPLHQRADGAAGRPPHRVGAADGARQVCLQRF